MNSNVDLHELAIDRNPPPRTPRRQVLTRYILPLTLMLGFLSLVAWASRDYLLPAKQVRVVPVYSTTAEVQRGGAPLFNAAGWIEPRPTPVRVAALAAGVIDQLWVVEDQPIEKGKPIATLVKDDAQLAHDRARANLKLRQAELAGAEAARQAADVRLRQPVHLEAALAEANAALAKIKTERKNLPFKTKSAAADLEAIKKDYQSKRASQGVIAGVEIDVAKSKVEAAQARLTELRERAAALSQEERALQQRRDALKTRRELLADETQALEQARAQVTAAQARVDQARVDLADAKLQLDRMTIVAPISGRVFRLVAHPGSRVGGGTGVHADRDGSTVVTMYRPDRLQVRVDVRFEDLPMVRKHQPVQINNPALAQPLTGRVLFISSEADIQKNTLEVKVEIADPPATFKPDTLVDVTFLAPERPGRKMEPSRALKIYVLKQLIHQSEGRCYVWLADPSRGRAIQQKIQTGRVSGNGLIEVTDGLTVASRLISGGTEGLRHGDRIEIRGEDDSLGVQTAPTAASEKGVRSSVN